LPVKSFRKIVNSKVCFALSPNSPCPCGSNKPTSSCCLTVTGFHKPQAITEPKSPRTGNSIEKCYANRVADCGQKLSREHYISESLLHYLNRNNELTISGLRWLGNEKKVVSPDSLTSKILCERHNCALSPLDGIAVRLFQAFDNRKVHGSDQRLFYLFNGHDIERWLLKILCGISRSQNLTLDSKIDTSIPDYWLEILFCGTRFPNNQGLYVCKSRGHQFEGPHGLQLQVITQGDRLAGMGLWVCCYELILSMRGFPSRSFDGRDVAYRPLEFYIRGRNFEKSVAFSWDGPADLGTVSVESVESQ